MKVMRGILFAVFMFGPTITMSANSQTVHEVPAVESQVTITKADLESVLSDQEITELEEYNETLRAHAAYGRSLPKGSKARADAVEMHEATKRERDQKYGHLRGLRGVTITSHGMPPPTGAEIVSQIAYQRLTGNGSGILQPHWIREPAGGIYGSSTPLKLEEVEGDGIIIPGAEFRASVRLRDRPDIERSDNSCGPIPEDWNYASRGEPTCKCFDNATVMGVTPCNWVSAEN